MAQMRDSLEYFSSPVKEWFSSQLGLPTPAQALSWPPIVQGRSTLLLAPTGSGKTLAAFLATLDQLMFAAAPMAEAPSVHTLYISPLKALGADVERNLRVPVSGIRACAESQGVPFRVPRIAMRTGDTSAAERARLKRAQTDILITTPESLYLMLTSAARQILRRVRTVIVDEIHALVPTKRGAHLALSLERLESLRDIPEPLQRIGLSATQTPLTEVAEFLGGWSRTDARPRPVEIVDAGRSKQLVLAVEMPARQGLRDTGSTAAPNEALRPTSQWSSIVPRLVELVRGHDSTLIFVNNRGLTERIAGAINELAQEEICLAHHGSVSKERRSWIEESLKRGELKSLVATSSLELGIDVGAVDLVVQIEAPPSIASAMQRVGRSGHRVGVSSKGVLFPKHRADLLSCAAAVPRMRAGLVESSRFPRSPLDVLAQQIVASAALERLQVDELFERVRQAAPFNQLGRASFEGVLDLLSGKYESDEFAGLRPRLVWDRKRGTLRARQGALRIAVTSGGTIPDRGLFGVFLHTDKPVRVGELDEEMVFESRVGDVFVLGASSWRIEDITHDRVLVSPAPAEVGRMPFWRGDAPGRPADFGRAMGALTRRLLELSRDEALELLEREHSLSESAAAELMDYLAGQRVATGEVPSDETLVVECFVDEVGDRRVCLLSPFGSPVHAAWALAAESVFQQQAGKRVESIWQNDGIVFRLPDAEQKFDASLLFPAPEDLEELVTAQLGQSALFAARFRENAMRALLMPRRRPMGRTPLWAQRKLSQRLLNAATHHPSFPILLETYRECLKDVFDLDALARVLADVAEGRIRIIVLESTRPSPFSASLLFAYAGNFVYEGDAPALERRARVLTVNHAELRSLLGEAELRKLLDPECLRELELSLAGVKHRAIRHVDGLADALLSYGDLTRAEIRERCQDPEQADSWLRELVQEGRVLELSVAGERRFIASEDAARYRDALAVALPPDLPEAFTRPSEQPMVQLVSRYARCHVPFTESDVADRFGVSMATARLALDELERRGRVEQGEFLPEGTSHEWCDRDVLRLLKRRSLQALRGQIEPVAPARLVELVVDWQRVGEPRRGIAGLLDSLEQLQGVALLVSELEQEVLPARVRDYASSWLDELISTGEVVWRGIESVGERNGRIAFYLTDQYGLLSPPPDPVEGELAAWLRGRLESRGASFFQDLLSDRRAFAPDVLKTLWQMVWAGEVTNDTFAPLRALDRVDRPRPAGRRSFRSRRQGPHGSEGRWSLLPGPDLAGRSSAKALASWAEVLLDRYAIVTREVVSGEPVPGGFGALVLVLRELEERSRVRRGFFVAGLSGQQFAAPSAADRLRRQRTSKASPLVLAATDPANPYGVLLPWPAGNPRPQRSSGGRVVLLQGKLLAYAGKGWSQLTTFFEREHMTEQVRAVADALATRVADARPPVMLIEGIDGAAADEGALGAALLERGFHRAPRGSVRGSGLQRSEPR